jgi:hypothetical protein
MNKATQIQSVGRVTVVMYMQVRELHRWRHRVTDRVSLQLPLILLLSCVVFGDTIDSISLAGCLIIIVSSAFVVLAKSGEKATGQDGADSGQYVQVADDVTAERTSLALKEEKVEQQTDHRRSFAAHEV